MKQPMNPSKPSSPNPKPNPLEAGATEIPNPFKIRDGDDGAEPIAAGPDGHIYDDHLTGVVADHEEFDEPMDGANSAGMLTREQFADSFVGVFNVAGRFTKLESLTVPDHERDGAVAAADALYDTALEIPWLNFLVQPGNVWVQRSLVIGAFTVPKAMAVSAELKARRQSKAKPGQKPQAQPPNAPGGDPGATAAPENADGMFDHLPEAAT